MDDNPTANWTAVQAAFHLRFPPVEKVVQSKSELECELVQMSLRMEDLGKTELFRGQNVYTHVIFANKALALANRAGIAQTTTLICAVCDNLPSILRRRISESYGDWAAFCATITGVDMAYIQDGVRKHEEDEKEKKDMLTRILRIERAASSPLTPQTLTLAIHQQMACTNLATPTSRCMPAFSRHQGVAMLISLAFPAPQQLSRRGRQCGTS